MEIEIIVTNFQQVSTKAARETIESGDAVIKGVDAIEQTIESFQIVDNGVETVAGRQYKRSGTLCRRACNSCVGYG